MPHPHDIDRPGPSRQGRGLVDTRFGLRQSDADIFRQAEGLASREPGTVTDFSLGQLSQSDQDILAQLSQSGRDALARVSPSFRGTLSQETQPGQEALASQQRNLLLSRATQPATAPGPVGPRVQPAERELNASLGAETQLAAQRAATAPGPSSLPSRTAPVGQHREALLASQFDRNALSQETQPGQTAPASGTPSVRPGATSARPTTAPVGTPSQLNPSRQPRRRGLSRAGTSL